ncbi:unnamed protein product [Rhizoctonia solani]|uniref:F-box domain-containing protein n=1 Tax=Rhizoctonia solani TaxID=456999 RepID=A0A8H3BAT7_9AGAM|nr:unnamed protein product [Rhizoctonia solani]
MSGLLSRLPIELRTLVVGQLKLRDLSSISLVCKTWQIVAFPYLYHTIRLSNVAHLQVLEERLLANDMPDSLSVSIHLRCLKLGGIGGIRDSDIHHFDIIVPKLTHLDCLYWELGFMPDNFHWFSTCPGLKSVHLLPKGIIDIDDQWIRRLDQYVACYFNCKALC